MLAQLIGLALQLGTMIILARLLSPSDYGLQSMVLTLTVFMNLFKDAGLSMAAVQREELTDQDLSTLFWINVGWGAFLMILTALMAPLLAAFYREPRLVWITIASATTFFFTSLSLQHGTLLNRAMRFGTNAKISIVTAVFGAAVAIVLAARGWGYWALIGQNISLPIITTIATWIAVPWIPGRPRWTPHLRGMLRFGGTITANSFVVYVAYNTEKILLGRYWGPAALGIYGRGYQLANLPVQQVSDSCGSVAFPMLSRLQVDPGRLRRSYLKTHSLVASLTVPAVVICAVFANELVTVILGPKWLASAPVLQLLSPTFLIFALINPFGWLLQASGRVQRSLNIALLIAPVVILGVALGLRHGPSGVALGYSAAMLILIAPCVAWSMRGTGITARDYLDSIKDPLLAAFFGGVVGWLVRLLIGGALSALSLLAIELFCFSATYIGTLFFVLGQKDFYIDIARNLLQRRDRSLSEALQNSSTA